MSTVGCDACDADSLDEMQTVAEAAASPCLLDLPVEKAADPIINQDSDLLLATSSDAAPSDQLFPYSDPLTRNGKDAGTESDHVLHEGLSISDSGALMTLNGVDHNDPAAGTDHLVADADNDLLSRLDDALADYIDGSSSAV